MKYEIGTMQLLEFVSLVGLILRHHDASSAADHLAFAYLTAIRLLPENYRRAIERGEKIMEPGFLASLPADRQGGESAISHIVGTMYGSEGSVT